MTHNILIISDRFANGGLETHILTYASALKKDKQNLFLLSTCEFEHDYTFFEKIFTISFDSSDTVQTLLQHIDMIKSIIKKEKIDIVHVHPFFGVIPSFFAAQETQTPFFVTLHGPISIKNHYGPFYDFFLKILLFHYAKVFLISHELEALTLSYGKSENFIYIPNPVDTTLFKAIPTSADIFEKWAIVSRLDNDKIHGVQACLEMAIQYGVKQIEIFGDGFAKDTLLEYTKTLDSRTTIIFRGFSTTLEEDLKNNYSLVAGMGRVALEAASLNIPVLLIGYDGIKGLLESDLFFRASWSNFSGRGISNISEHSLKQAFQDIQKNRSKYLLRELIVKEFSLTSVYPKYIQNLDNVKYIPFPYCFELKNIFNLYLNDSLPYLNHQYLINDYLTFMKNKYLVSSSIRNNIDTIESEWTIQEVNDLKKELQAREQELQAKDYELQVLQNQFNILNNELNDIKQSTVWRLATKYYTLRDSNLLISKTINFLKKYKPKAVSSDNTLINKKHKKQLADILKAQPTQPIMILPPLVDWNIPLFQRPQHLARNIAKQNVLYFFSTPNGLYDTIDGFEEVSPGCYITNRFDLVDQIPERKKIYDLSSTDNGTDWEFVQTRINRGDTIIYQYIDEISEEISGHAIPKSLFEKHFNILKDERCIVIPSASKLEEDVREHRTKNYKLVTNGVEIEHFSQRISPEQYPALVRELLAKNKPVIGYFGAFANWFDYELVIKLATQRPDLEILLLGVDYDGSIKKYHLEQYDNITIAGPIDYKELPRYAAAFSVSTIPFLINDITESTSPIKLFEYMAMGKPIITTDMPECRKYKSVLIGKDHDEFIAKISEALELAEDETYIELLGKEALENSWEAKAEDIVGMVENQEKKK